MDVLHMQIITPSESGRGKILVCMYEKYEINMSATDWIIISFLSLFLSLSPSLSLSLSLSSGKSISLLVLPRENDDLQQVSRTCIVMTSYIEVT